MSRLVLLLTSTSRRAYVLRRTGSSSLLPVSFPPFLLRRGGLSESPLSPCGRWVSVSSVRGVFSIREVFYVP